MTNMHIGGYHGTSLEIATAIVSTGFEWQGRPICFAPLDEEGFERAKAYGAFRAECLGESSFSIVEAAFGPAPEDYDSLGRPQIELTEEQSGFIHVRRTTVDFSV